MALLVLKILFLASWFPNRTNPKFGLFIKKHVIAVSKICTVAVLHIRHDPDLKHNTYDIEYFKENDIFIVIVYYKISDLHGRLTTLIRLFRYCNGLFKGFKIILKHFGKPDLVHLNVISNMGLLALYLKFLKKIPFIVTEHSTRYMPMRGLYKGRLKKLFTSLVIKNTKSVTTVSNFLAQSMKYHGLNNNYYIVPNTISFFDISTKKSNDNKKKIILHVSTLYNHQKNVEGIIRAIKNILAIRNDFELRIIGGEHDKHFLESLVEELGLENYVIFYGGVSDLELKKHYQEADFFVLNSNYETFSVVTAESLACGIPVIVTRSGGPEEFVTPEQGIIIEPNNQKELEKAIAYMLDNHGNYDKNKLSKYARSKFSDEVVGKLFFEIYEKTIEK